MFGKKKNQAQSLAELATIAIDQSLESLAANADQLRAQALMTNDAFLGPYLNEQVDWPLLWSNAAKRAPGLMMNMEECYNYAGGLSPKTSVLQHGTQPYWEIDSEQVGGFAPISSIAFLGHTARRSIAGDREGDPRVIRLLAKDPARIVGNTASMNLVARGLLNLRGK